MNKLLNRFAWFLSLCFGFIIAFVAIGLDTGTIRSDDILFSTFWGTVVGLLIKRFLLGEVFIEDRILYFAKHIRTSQSTLIPEEEKVDQKFGDNHERASVSTMESNINKGLQELPEDIYDEEEKDIDTYKTQKTLKSTMNDPLTGSITMDHSKIEKIEEVPGIFDVYMGKASDYIKEFFATNTLAKIGAILIFLAVVFFLRGVAETFWEVIGPVGRLLIGFAIAFTTFGVGTFLHGRGNENEGLILIGLSILLNYGVILSGRYLIGESSLGEDGFLTETVTFLLLIFNTTFGVVTSLVYRSRTLLIFSFIFAYINPFIIGAESSGTPYTLVGYSLIISLGGLFLGRNLAGKSIIEKEINSTKHNILVYLIFILGNLLILFAPFTTNIDWIIKMFSSVFLSSLTIFTFYYITKTKIKKRKSGIVNLFLGSYVFIFLLLLVGGTHNDILSNMFSYVTYIGVLIGFFLFTSLLLKKDTNNAMLQFLLFAPLIILLGIMLSGQVFSVIGLLIIFMALYLGSFIFLQSFLPKIVTYTYFVLMGVFICISNTYLIFDGQAYDIISFISIVGVSFLFLFSTYYFSLKNELSHLYSIGTILTILLLVPVLIFTSTIDWLKPGDILESGNVTTNFHVNISTLAVIIFALSNWILPFINKNLLSNPKNISNLIIGSLAGVLFIAFEMYNFGAINFPGIAQGLAFGVLAIIYFIQSFLVVQKMGSLQSLSAGNESGEQSSSLKNIFYTYAGISLSLFSLAIAFVFSKYPEIISTVWLFEATIIYYFYAQTKQWKLLIAGNILFFIGIVKLATLSSIVQSGDYNFLVSFTVIAASLILNIRFIDGMKDVTGKVVHYIFHIIGISILGLLLSKIIVSSGHGWSSLGISIFVTAIGFYYALLKTEFLKWFFIVIFIGFSVFHISSIDYILYRLDRDDLEYLIILQYIVTAIVVSSYFIWNTNSNKKFIKIVTSIIGVYLFIISNLYILDIFGKIFGHFSLTIYWGIIASILLFYGIANGVLKFRTIGLYFIILTSLKIFLFDVWQLDNTSSRVIALMGLGILFIIISTFYTKKYGNNILNELSFDNLKDHNLKGTEVQNETKKTTIKPLSGIHSSSQDQISTNKTTDKKIKKVVKTATSTNEDLYKSEEETNDFMKKLSKINVDNIKVVRFSPNKGDKFTIRAKNLLRVSKLVVNQTGKTIFSPKELNGIYNYVEGNYKSNLSRREYDKLRTSLKGFVDQGGEVEIVKK